MERMRVYDVSTYNYHGKTPYDHQVTISNTLFIPIDILALQLFDKHKRIALLH